MSGNRIVQVWTERYEVYATWYVILTDNNNKPYGLRLFDVLVVYPDGHTAEYHVFDVPLPIVRGIGLLGESYAR
jgi:hypothetical protein